MRGLIQEQEGRIRGLFPEPTTRQWRTGSFAFRLRPVLDYSSDLWAISSSDLQTGTSPNWLRRNAAVPRKRWIAISFSKALDESRIESSPQDRRLVAKLQTDSPLGRGEAGSHRLALDEKAQFRLDDIRIDAAKCGHCSRRLLGFLIRSREKDCLKSPMPMPNLRCCKDRALQTFQYRGCKLKLEAKPWSKTMSIRMDRDN